MTEPINRLAEQEADRLRRKYTFDAADGCLALMLENAGVTETRRWLMGHLIDLEEFDDD